MNAQMAWGIAAGLMCMSGVAAWRRVRNADRTIQLVLLISTVLAVIALLSAVFDPSAASNTSRALAVLLIVAGGMVYRMRGYTLTPAALLITSGLLAIITLTKPANAALMLSDWIAALTCIAIMPAFDTTTRMLRNDALSFDSSIVLWFGLSLALLAFAITNLIQRGLWLESHPGTTGLLAAWIAIAGSFLLRRSRMRAILIFVAACALVAQAWHVLI